MLIVLSQINYPIFNIYFSCPTVFRGAPADVAAQKSREMGDKILAGQACEASSVI